MTVGCRKKLLAVHEDMAELKKFEEHNFYLPPHIRAILQLSEQSKILIIGPAPGIRAHETGIPWNDASGRRLMSWLDLPSEVFYDAQKIALVSMNFWYPGKDSAGNDKPPRLIDAERWHRPLLKLMPNIQITILIGHKAQSYILKEKAKASLTDTMKAWQSYLPKIVVLPHPSWHNNAWIEKHRWFDEKVLPELRKRVRRVLNA